TGVQTCALPIYNQRAGAENLIKEANDDAGLAAHPSEQWAANCVHFQLAMLAYNLNCWLLLFNREEKVQANDLKHTTLVTARLRFRSEERRVGKSVELGGRRRNKMKKYERK